MVNVPVIAKRELSSYFLSPIAYVVLTAFALMHGIFFCLALSPALSAQVDLNMAVRQALIIPGYLLVFAIPIVTMRLLSEETSRGTIETLMTTPASEAEVVLGKFLGALVFATVMFVPLGVEALFLRYLGTYDYGILLSGLLGLFLLTAQFVAIGLFFSALTSIQVASAILTFAALFGLYFVWALVRGSPAAWARALRYIAPPWHYFDAFLKGVVDTRDLAYFVVTTVACLFLGVKGLQLRKWR